MHCTHFRLSFILFLLFVMQIHFTGTALRKQKSFDSSSEDDQIIDRRRRSKDSATSVDSDVDSEKRSPKSRLLRQMEKELAKDRLSGSESDELVPIRNSIGQHISSNDNKKLSASIYSDSDSTDKDKTDNTASDSQNHTFRTKAALKEFNSHSTATKSTGKNVTNKSKEKQTAEKERLQQQQQETFEQEQQTWMRKDKSNKEKPQKEKLSKAKEKAERLEKVEKERLQREKVEKDRMQREKSEKERLQREKVEKERLAKIEQERIEKESAEKERIDRLKTEKSDKTKKKRKDASKEFSTDFLVVPQRQAAKKASENMMRTTVLGGTRKDQTKDDEKKELPKSEASKIKDARDSKEIASAVDQTEATSIAKDTVTIKQPKGKTSKATANKHLNSPQTESIDTKDTIKSNKKSDKLDKDIMVAYVPQRQAAKKAAEHIKGLGKGVTNEVQTKVDDERLSQSQTPSTTTHEDRITLPSTRAKSLTASLSAKTLPRGYFIIIHSTQIHFAFQSFSFFFIFFFLFHIFPN